MSSIHSYNPTCSRHYETGPFDLIGDVHGCASELETLLAKLDYRLDSSGVEGWRSYNVSHPQDRRVIFLGDLVDRGPRSPDVLRLVKSMVDAGTALCVIGNHDFKLMRWLDGKTVKMSHGIEQTIAQLKLQPEGLGEEMRVFIEGLPTHIVLEDGALVVAHAGLRENLHNTCSDTEKSFAMFGDITGERDEHGLPERRDWAAEYSGSAAVVYGHMAVAEARWVNNAICLDTGCVFGGKLTALRWPERELVQVAAERTYFQSPRGLR